MKKYLTINDVLEIIRELSCSQGFYGRLYQRIMDCKQNDPENYAEFVDVINSQKFVDKIDVVFFFEC